MYIHWALDTKPMILSMDPLKLMLSSYNFLVAIDLSHSLWLSSLPPLFLSFCYFNTHMSNRGLRSLTPKSSSPISVTYKFLTFPHQYPITSLKSWFYISHPLFSFRFTFSFISLTFSVHGSAPLSYNPPPPLYCLFLEELRFHILVL